MIISLEDGPLVYHCLRCWDAHDVPVENITWFNSDTLVASARINRVEQRVEIGRFIFLAVLETTAERLQRTLPESLHQYIKDIE